jgi:hypothetical protein
MLSSTEDASLTLGAYHVTLQHLEGLVRIEVEDEEDCDVEYVDIEASKLGKLLAAFAKIVEMNPP